MCLEIPSKKGVDRFKWFGGRILWRAVSESFRKGRNFLTKSVTISFQRKTLSYAGGYF